MSVGIGDSASPVAVSSWSPWTEIGRGLSSWVLSTTVPSVGLCMLSGGLLSSVWVLACGDLLSTSCGERVYHPLPMLGPRIGYFASEPDDPTWRLSVTWTVSPSIGNWVPLVGELSSGCASPSSG